MKAWLSRFNQREQLSLLLMALIVGMYCLYVMVWSPVAGMRNDMAQRNLATAQALARVDAMASEVTRLRDGGAQSQKRRNLTSVINQSTSRLKLPVSRLQPNSRGEIQVRLENAGFDDVLGWLYEMEYQESLLVREVSITQAGSTGRVNASVRIGQGS